MNKLIKQKSVSIKLDIDVDEVRKSYFIRPKVDFVPYEGTILNKSLDYIMSLKDRKKITIKEFKQQLMELCGYSSDEYLAESVTFAFYAYWNNDGDIDCHNTLASGVNAITLYIKKR